MKESHLINFNDQIFCFEISPYDWSQNVICVAIRNKIIIGVIKFPENSEIELFEWFQLKELHHENRCDAISIAPETTLELLPKCVKFCTADSDYNIRIYCSDLDANNTVQLLQGHSSYINTIAWEPDNGKYLASGSDDHSCIIWNSDNNFEGKTMLHLKSAIMSVKWHPDDIGKLLVAEKQGNIYMYKVETAQIILSIETSKSPLISADWALNNRLFVTALAAGDIITYDLRRPCRPVETKSTHENVGRIIKFSPHSEYVTASIGRPNNTMKIIHMQSKFAQLEAPIKLFGGLCWHYKLPYIIAASDRKLLIWKVHIK